MSADAVIEQSERDEIARHAAIDVAVKTWRPRGDRVLLAKVRPVEKKVGSIVVPGQGSPMGDKIERKGLLARVVAVGPDATLDVNDRVYCSSFQGAVVEIDGHSLLVISEAELLLNEVAAE